MVDKNFLKPAYKQTQVEGGSSYTNPLGRLNREALGGDESGSRNDSSFDDSSRGRLGENAAFLTSESSGLRDDSRYESRNNVPSASDRSRDPYDTTRDRAEEVAGGGLAGAGGAAAARSQDRYDDRAYDTTRRDRTEEAIGRGLAGAGGTSAARSQDRYDNQRFSNDRQGIAGGVDQTRSAGTQGSTGLETRDPHAAAAQAGALLDMEDIREINRETEAGRVAGAQGVGSAGGAGYRSAMDAGLGSRGMASDVGGVGSTNLSSTGGQGLSSTGGSGFVSGEHRDEPFDRRKLQGQDGLIHGHHTTATGERLDPHLKR